MAGKLETARALRASQIKNVRAEIVTVASQRLELLRNRLMATFGAASVTESPVVREARFALDERAHLIVSVANGEGDAETREHITSLAEERLAISHPDAATMLREAAIAEERLFAAIHMLNKSRIVGTVNAYDGSTTDAILFESDPDLLGVRLASAESDIGNSFIIAVIDDPEWPRERSLVRLGRSSEGPYRAIASNNSIWLEAPNSAVTTNIEVETELDDRFAAVMDDHDQLGLWEENTITAGIVMALRHGKEPRTFAYRIGEQWVAVRLKITKQRGKPEYHLGDLCLIIEQLDAPDDDPKKVGVAAVEAKKRDYITGLLQALDKEQAERILRNAPLARLLIYDARAPVGWHAACMPLREYSRLRPGAESAVLKSEGVRFSEQLTRRFFLNKELEFDPNVVENAFINFDKYTYSGFGGVAKGSSREEARQRAQQNVAMEELLAARAFERSREVERRLNLTREGPKIEREGPHIERNGPSLGM